MANIVVLDDSESARALVQRVLGARGHRVVPCDSPFKIISLLASERPDLVLIDVDMPALTGDRVVQAIRRYELDHCAIVFYSARPENELQLLVAKTGAAGFIPKDIGGSELGRRVEAWLPVSA